MPEEKLNKINALGGAISVWGKLLIGLFVFVFTVGTAWYQIETNAADNMRQDEQMKQLLDNQQNQFENMMESVTKEFEIQAQRSDKRYTRAMKEAEELHEEDDKHEQQILELTKEIWYIKGKLDEQDRH